MKKLSIIIASFFLIIISIIIYNYNQNKDIYIGKKEEIKEENNSSIAIMLQNEEGQYVKSTNNEWPTSGYAFNENKSKCEQGSKLLWNELTHSVMLKTTKSEKCYVYFDKGYSVTVEVTGGHVDQSPKTVVSGSDAIFTLTADEGYDLAKAKVTEGQCELSNNNATLTAKNITGNMNCKVEISSSEMLEINPFFKLPGIQASVNEEGLPTEVVVSEFKPSEAGETKEEAVLNALTGALDKNIISSFDEVKSADVFDVDMADGTQPDGPVTVTFVFETKNANNMTIMYFNEATGNWDSAQYEKEYDGLVTVTFEHFCTMVVLYS